MRSATLLGASAALSVLGGLLHDALGGASALAGSTFGPWAATEPRASAFPGFEPPPSATRPAPVMPDSEGCMHCHAGIEEMHPGFPLSCVDCHGGDGDTREKLQAHVQSTVPRTAETERVPPLDQDLAYVRFVNPMDLRVAEKTCGGCHGELVEHLRISLHGTTAGHLSDGFYEIGHAKERGSKYGVFPEAPLAPKPGSTLARVVQPPELDSRSDRLSLASHFPDLSRKECMQCHLWSQGRAVRGRVGFDGDYRGAGCAACHVPYALNGMSESGDRTTPRNEPGHPRAHALVAAPPTSTCTTCHYGDASIGLHFRGLSQLPPGAPGGPEIPGTTAAPLNRAFYIDDPVMTPPDVHHASGLHCVDCHTLGDTMGDGRFVGWMEEAVEISCESCHGTFTERTRFVTERGTKLKHLFERDGAVWLRSKVTGAEHRVKQAVDVVTPGTDDFNAEAARAMTGAHGTLECYTCHAGWNVNFLGFHFYRNEALSQLDLLSGRRTPGRVTTQEKVFATWKSFYAGLNEAGRVAPYLTGFSTMGTVDDADGNRILDQELPVTAAGRSGLTMIHHQLHSTRPTARSCVECHRNSGTWGLGSANFHLGRQVAYVADRRGIEVVALDRGQLASSTPIAKLVQPDVVDLELDCDPLQGFGRYLYVSEGGRGVHVVDVRDPARPRRVAFRESVSPRGLALSGDVLLVADGVGGLKVYDVSEPARITRIATLPTLDAHEVEVRWPYAYVADGPGGLLIVDISVPVTPKVVGGRSLVGGRADQDATVDLDVLFQFSRPMVDDKGAPLQERTEARMLVACLDEEVGLFLVDATEPTSPRMLFPTRGNNERSATHMPSPRDYLYRGLSLRSKVDVATPQGGEPTRERDYVYFVEERPRGNGEGDSFLRLVDVTDPKRPQFIRPRTEVAGTAEHLLHASFYNAPFLQPYAMVSGEDGLAVVDLSNSKEPVPGGVLRGIRDTWVAAVEEFPLDRMVAPNGAPLKDVSHAESRWLRTPEIARVLGVDAEALGLLSRYDQIPSVVSADARAVFRRADVDRDGLVTGAELASLPAGSDRNTDGRVTLAELVEFQGRAEDAAEGRSRVEPGALALLESRVDRDGDLARLLDGTDPYDFDKKRDGRLDRKELTAAFFAALDLDGDGRLNVAELSRHPGPLRQIRYGDESGLARFGKLDRSGGGTISLREFSLRDEDWDALDADGDGAVQLTARRAGGRDAVAERRGVEQLPAEWPTRRVGALLTLAPTTDELRLLGAFDVDRDGELTKRELRKRLDLLQQLDADGSDRVTTDEVAAALARLADNGVEVTPDSFEGRWDLDGDGKVSDDELPDRIRALLARRAR
ncbi:MAG: hypothetical protein R3F49_08615 [Planctomycetota bacterium]